MLSQEIIHASTDLLNAGEGQKVVELLTPLIASHPYDTTLHVLLGFANYSNGDVGIALHHFSTAHIFDPHNRDIVGNIISLYRKLGEQQAALAVLKKYLQLVPTDNEYSQLISELSDASQIRRSPLRGSWIECGPYLDIHPTVLIGDGAVVDVRYRPLHQKVAVTIGEDSQFFGTISIQRPGASISIGLRSQVGSATLIASDSITIGNDVLISWGITIVDSNSHSLSSTDRRLDVVRCGYDHVVCPEDFIRHKDWKNILCASVVIEDKAWIGFGSTILKGVTIGEGAIVSAQSVVTRDVQPYTVVAGNPAQLVDILS